MPTKVDEEPVVIVVMLDEDKHRELWHMSHATAVTEFSYVHTEHCHVGVDGKDGEVGPVERGSDDGDWALLDLGL